jgi:hypothetical protein
VSNRATAGRVQLLVVCTWWCPYQVTYARAGDVNRTCPLIISICSGRNGGAVRYGRTRVHGGKDLHCRADDSMRATAYAKGAVPARCLFVRVGKGQI